MKKLFTLVMLFVITLSALLMAWKRDLWQTRPAIPVSFQASAPAELPQVNLDRLLQDLKALEFERYSQAGRDRARAYVQQALTAAGWTVQPQPFVEGINLYAERPGTEDTAAILLGAHYDSVERSPGSDDNASGVAVVLEAARLLADVPTPRPLKIVLFDQEESGLAGSQAFVQDDRQITDLAGALIMEMVGYSCEDKGCQGYPENLPIPQPSDRGNFLAVVGDQGHASLIDAFLQPESHTVPVFTLAVPLLGPIVPDVLRSDHVSFWQKGVGAVMVTDTANFRNPNYHRPSDTVDSLNLEFLAGAAQTVVNALTLLLHSSTA